MGEQFKLALKSPLTYALVFVASIASYFISVYTNRTDSDRDDCKERVRELEVQMNEYTRAVLFQNAQIENRDGVIDSLKKEVVK